MATQEINKTAQQSTEPQNTPVNASPLNRDQLMQLRLIYAESTPKVKALVTEVASALGFQLVLDGKRLKDVTRK